MLDLTGQITESQIDELEPSIVDHCENVAW